MKLFRLEFQMAIGLNSLYLRKIPKMKYQAYLLRIQIRNFCNGNSVHILKFGIYILLAYPSNANIIWEDFDEQQAH